jgi:hypothetical protein
MPRGDHRGRRQGLDTGARARSAAADHQPAAVDRWFPRPSRRSAITFAVLAVLLLVPWPGFGRAFAVLFSGYANAVVQLTGAGSALEPRFSAWRPQGAPQGASENDAADAWAVWLVAARAPERAPTPLDTRIIGYTPLALFVALTLASAVPRRRKLAIFGIGGGLLLLRLAIAIALPTARALGGSRLASGPLVETIWYVLIDSPAISYVAPLGAWWLGLALTSPPGARLGARQRASTTQRASR